MTRPDAAPDAAGDDLAAIERKALSLLAGTTPGRLDVHRCDADGGAIDYQLQRAPGTPATALGYATDRDGSSRAKADATLWAHAHEMTTAVVTLARQLAAQQAAHAAALDGARAEALREAGDVARDVVWHAMLHHPLPWRVEDDWTREVTAADGTIIAKCMTFARAEAIIATAERIAADLAAHADEDVAALAAPGGGQ